MKRFLKWAGIVVGVLLVSAGSAYGWASWKTSSLLARTFEPHSVDFPVPFPLTEEEIAELRAERLAELQANAPAELALDGEGPGEDAEAQAEGTGEAEPAAPSVDPLEGVDLDAIAMERAVERGRHLVQARYACVECHGRDFSGGVMVDDPMLGRLLGPNITLGAGSRTLEYTVADWDHIVRHGILPDGRPAAMPAEDFQRMSDQELSDIIAYVRSFPPVDAEVERPTLGPLGTVLMATGKLPLSADLVRDHAAHHQERPPFAAPTAEFGEHLAGVCTGCHRANLEGGPIASGDPSWPPAANLTPHAEGLAGWTYDDFVAALREARRPDGTELRVPMALMTTYAADMTDVEMEALWAYLRSVEPVPTGQ